MYYCTIGIVINPFVVDVGKRRRRCYIDVLDKELRLKLFMEKQWHDTQA